jgi:hypothetical protein
VEFFQRISKFGATGRWVARAAVEHRISAERQMLGYVSKYFQGIGYTSFLLDNSDRRLQRRTRLRRNFHLARLALSFLGRRLFRPAEVWLPSYASLNREIGWRSAYLDAKASKNVGP